MGKKVLLFAVFLSLTACAGDKGPPRSCPQVAVLRDLERIEDYGSDTRDPANLVALAAMRGVEGSCDYKGEGVEIAFELLIGAEKGPRLGGDQIGFPFFVSLINPDGEVRSKEIMTTQIVFPAGGKSAQKSEPLRVFIPLKEGENGAFYRVLMGFQLTEAQLKAAREK